MSSPTAATIGVALLVASILGAACGGNHSPLSPSSHEPLSTAPGATRVLQGQTASAADSSTFAGVSVQLATRFPATSDANGYFRVENDLAGTSVIELSGSSIVNRRTDVRLPADGIIKFTLIPASFDLVAYDEMFRGSHERLQRWTTAPSLVVLTSVMRFESSESSSSEATSEQIPADQVEELMRDLTQGLATLTGNTYTAFARVTRESPDAGSRVSTARSGQIVVARYRDLKALSQVVGYGRWAERDDAVITAGSMFLDSAYDATSERRRLLRIHELGHALGYKHVTTRASIMNAVLGSDVTDFDRQGAVIAFQRPPGNHAPDTDPAPGVRTLSEGGGVRWTSQVP